MKRFDSMLNRSVILLTIVLSGLIFFMALYNFVAKYFKQD